MTHAPAAQRLLTPSFLIVVGATFAFFAGVGMLLPTLPLFISGPLGGGSVAVGLVAGIGNVSALVMNPWAGRLADRHGRRLLMASGAALVAGALAGMLVAGTIPALLALRLVAGAGDAMFFVGGASAINDMAPEERRGEAVSYFSLALHAGIGVGPVLGETVLAGSRFPAVWTAAAGCALLALLLGLRLSETRPATAAVPGGLLIHPGAVTPGLVLTAGGIGAAGFNAFVPLYAREIGLAGSRFVFVTFSTVLVLVRALGARVPDRLGALHSAKLALLGTSSGLAIISAWRAPMGLFGGTVVFALGHALLFPAMLMLAVRRAPAHQRASVVGTLTAFLSLGFAAGPASLGVVAGGAGYSMTFLAAATAAACGFVYLWRSGARLAGPAAVSS